MKSTLGIVAVAFLLATTGADAQDQSCKLRCTTLYQFFDNEITATIPLTCDAETIHCKGDGALRINGEMVPTVFAATFTTLGLDLLVLTAQGELAIPTITFGTVSPTQSKTFVARWKLPPKAPSKVPPKGPKDFTLRQMHAIGGHIKLTVENYERPPLSPSAVKSR
ncbi:MAG: hypothetical protein K0Q70_758 [Rhodospirillales bacterium]|nr:hypothetical protein [Rhodospirillales bacterium]